MASGGTPSRNKKEYWGGGVPWVKISDIPEHGRVARTEESISKSGLSNSSAKIFPKGTILFTIFATIGKVGILEIDAATNQAICGVQPLSGINPRFLFHYLRYASRNLLGTSHGITQKNINMSIAKTLPVPLAPEKEQPRVAARLEDFLQAITTARKALEDTKCSTQRFRRAVLAKAFRGELTERDPNDEPAEKLLERVRQERRKKWEESLRAKGKDPRKHKYEEPDIFDTEELPILPYTWAWTTIGAIASFIGSGITPLGGQNVYVSKGIPFIRSQNVYPSGIHLEDIVYITPEMHAEMKRTHVRPDDVLLNITGASIGRSTYVPPCFGEANVNQHVCILRTGWWMIPSYLSNFLNSPLGQDQIFATESGVTREGLNYGQIRKMKIPFAPLNEQKRVTQRIAEMFARASTAERAVRDGLKQADVFEQSILNGAFRGELVPQDPSDEPASVLLERIRVQRAATKKKGKFQTQLELVVPSRIGIGLTGSFDGRARR